MPRFTVPLIALALLLSACRMTAQDSVHIATIVGGAPVPTIPLADLACAVESLRPGMTVTSVSLYALSPDWLLLAEGTQGAQTVTIGFTLTQHGTMLYAANSNRWDECRGFECSGCELKKDALDRPYCNCYKPAGQDPRCDHSTGRQTPGLVQAIEACES